METEEFKQLLENHDWTYQYSDDPHKFQKGHQEWRTIGSVIQENPELRLIYEEFKEELNG